jgi:hypothetical protein
VRLAVAVVVERTAFVLLARAGLAAEARTVFDFAAVARTVVRFAAVVRVAGFVADDFVIDLAATRTAVFLGAVRFASVRLAVALLAVTRFAVTLFALMVRFVAVRFGAVASVKALRGAAFDLVERVTVFLAGFVAVAPLTTFATLRVFTAEIFCDFAATAVRFVADFVVRGFEATAELLLATLRFEAWDRTAIEWPPYQQV